MSDLIQDGQTLESAVYDPSGYKIQTYDNGFGPLWISRNSLGINGIVRAETWEDAYSICEDEFFPEADETIEQLQAEYGFEMDNELFQESFGFRPNGPNVRDTVNHGIYSKDLNGDALDLLTPEIIEAIGIKLTISGEEACEQ